MLNWKSQLSAATLPVVMVISVLILLVVLFVYSLWDMNFLHYSSYHYKKQQRENLNSAVVLYSNDSTFITEYNKEKTFQLYETDSASTVSFFSQQWGFYESLRVSSHNGNFSSTRLLGKKQECDHRAALWLCDRNRALSLSGETEIRGKIFIPLNGINYTEIDGEYYKGEEIPYTRLDIAGAQLPPIDSTTLVFPESLKGYRDRSNELPAITQTYYSFHESTHYFNISENRDEIVLRGNAVLFADELKITASSKINEAIIIARKVTIEEGFTGSMQVFCSDSVLVGENVTLQYPSGIYLDAEIDYPYVSLSDNSEINGYVIILGRIRDEELLFPSYRQSGKSLLRGLLYVDGTTNFRGEISGAVYLKDCFFTSNRNVYAGTLYNTRISRNDNIAYPIFLSGEYTRKEIKSIY
ncbi:hypothetical protein [Proteiniphilum sp. X52]|uniref:hypothetical protein n=1 Tax=Proteiniphilum sp. X52 TaxID=2382159 RepID=UPI000F0A2539|nr:hypothetical protein [Proteiniphilum sp. X52]RNC63889.1 hypothetical protein D7D25_14365 [Proteiniphilum sp. X52]